MTSMEWTAVGSIGTCVMGLLILVSITFMLKQNRVLSEQNKNLQRSLKSATHQALMQNEAVWYRLMVENPELDKIIYREEKESDPAHAKAYWTGMAILCFMENICVQREVFGLIGDESWPSWENYIKDDLGKFSYLSGIISRKKGMFPQLEKLVGISTNG